MIVKRNINVAKSLPYVKIELALGTFASLLVFLVYDVANIDRFAIPNVLPVMLGTALSIFLGFRNNAAYSRWTEGAQLWTSIASSSRRFARLIITFVEAHNHTEAYDTEKARAYQKEMIYRQLAWVHALRIQLRPHDESSWNELQPFLSKSEWNTLMNKSNKPSALLMTQGHRIYDAMRTGTLQGFDSFQLEGCLAELTVYAGNCDRLKRIPIPRQYTFFTRLFVWFFIFVIPFSFVQTFAVFSRAWIIIPVTVMLSYVFGIVERTGAVNEEPFENRITDVPLNSFCVDIERDLREMLDESELPSKLVADRLGMLY